MTLGDPNAYDDWWNEPEVPPLSEAPGEPEEEQSPTDRTGTVGSQVSVYGEEPHPDYYLYESVMTQVMAALNDPLVPVISTIMLRAIGSRSPLARRQIEAASALYTRVQYLARQNGDPLSATEEALALLMGDNPPDDEDMSEGDIREAESALQALNEELNATAEVIDGLLDVRMLSGRPVPPRPSPRPLQGEAEEEELEERCWRCNTRFGGNRSNTWNRDRLDSMMVDLRAKPAPRAKMGLCEPCWEDSSGLRAALVAAFVVALVVLMLLGISPAYPLHHIPIFFFLAIVARTILIGLVLYSIARAITKSSWMKWVPALVERIKKKRPTRWASLTIGDVVADTNQRIELERIEDLQGRPAAVSVAQDYLRTNLQRLGLPEQRIIEELEFIEAYSRRLDYYEVGEIYQQQIRTLRVAAQRREPVGDMRASVQPERTERDD